MNILQRILAQLACVAKGHRFEVAQVFSRHFRRVICHRCHGDWVVSRIGKKLFPWDATVAQICVNQGDVIIDPWRPSPSGLPPSPVPAPAGLDSPIRTHDTGPRDYVDPVSVGYGEGEAEKLLRHSFALLTRYRRETPLGHQPHMIAHQADELIDKIDAYLAGGPAPAGASACPHGVPHRWNCEQCDHP
jgi:hypothetical protein